MKHARSCQAFTAALISIWCQSAAAIPAFPGAEGFGANSIGGRGGAVLKVTTLADSGAGSFRAAVTAPGPRIVVFEVSGIINLESSLNVTTPYLTIAGETSPGGILVTGYQTTLRTHDVIVRHMRFRVGSHRISDGADPEKLDSFDIWGRYWGGNDAYNIIVDHCSMSWGVDETMTVTGGVTDTTVQWSIISEGLSRAGHPKGEHSKGLLVSGKYEYPNSVSLHHNYIAHNNDRSPLVSSPSSPRVEMLVDATNNVSYNWKGGLAPKSTGSAKVNWVYNYAKQGANSNSYSFEITMNPPTEDPTVTPLIYVFGNIGSTRFDQSDPHWNVGVSWRNELADEVWRQLVPWPVPAVTTSVMSAEVAECIVSAAGATAPVRDSVDARVAADFVNGTGAIIDDITFPDDFPTFASPASPTDADADGMADVWETSSGLNTSSNDSAGDLDGDGYTNIEEYLHFLSDLSLASIDTSLCLTTESDVLAPAAPTGLTLF